MPTEGSRHDEAVNVVRAASGGLLFGVPLLYTMEVWWIGSHTDPAQMLTVLSVLAVVLFTLNMTAGFRETRDVRVATAAADTIEALAVGLFVTSVVLGLLRELTVETPLTAALGKVVRESVPFCLGIGVARLLLQGDPGMTVREGEAQFHLDVSVTNHGDETAANVQVNAELIVDGDTTSADQVVDFLAGAEEVDLVFVFDDDPRRGELEVTVASYAIP